MNNFSHFIAGGIAGCAEVLTTMPLEVLKTNVQIKNNSISDIFKNIIGNNGFKGLYAGTIPYMSQCALKLGFRFSSYNFLNNKFKSPNINELYTNFISGITAGTLESLLLTTPTERMKILQQTKGSAFKKNIIKETIQKEGIFTLLKGYESTSLRQSTSIAIRFTLYKPIKEFYSEYISNKKQNIISLLSGGTSGFISAVINNPLDVIKTNQQKLGNNLGFIDLIKKIYKKNGISGYYKGLLLRSTRIFIAQGVVFCVYENVLNLF